MRLDAMIDQIDNLSSTQLYGIIVAVTVGLCVVLLGTGNTNLDFPQQQQSQRTQRDNDNTVIKKPVVPASGVGAVGGGRQPRWHIFKWVNYLAVAAFLWSVCTFCLNASQYLDSQNTLIKFLVGWSVFLLYFFGFFGVFLIHEDIPKDETTTTTTTSEMNVGSSSAVRYVASSFFFFIFFPTVFVFIRKTYIFNISYRLFHFLRST
jgi:hypothetical protein